MKYNISFNQKAVIDNKWDCLTANHMVVLDGISGYMTRWDVKKIIENGETWYWVSIPEIIRQTPILRIKDRRCRDIVKELSDCGLVDLYKDNKKLNKHFLKLGVNYQKLIYAEDMQNNANQPKKDMQNNAKGYAEKCKPDMQNNADYNSIKRNNSINIINKEKENASLVFFEEVFKLYKTLTTVGSHKAQAFERFKKLSDVKQQKLFEYLKEYSGRRQKIEAAKGWLRPLPAFEKFIRDGYWENVDLPELKREQPKQTAIPKFL